MNPSWRKNYLRYRTYFLNVSTQYRQRADVKVYLEILLSLATVILFAIFALRPTLTTIAQLITEIESKKETLSVMEAKLQNISAALTIYDQKSTSIRLVEDAIPRTSSPNMFVRHIEGLVLKNNNILTDVTIDQNIIHGEGALPPTRVDERMEALPPGSDALAFRVIVSGPLLSYQALHNFLSDIEKLRRPVKIDSIDLSVAVEQQTKEKVLLLTVNGRTPFHKPEEVAEE